MNETGQRSYNAGWLAQLDRARALKANKDHVRQLARGSRKRLPKWAEAELKVR